MKEKKSMLSTWQSTWNQLSKCDHESSHRQILKKKNGGNMNKWCVSQSSVSKQHCNRTIFDNLLHKILLPLIYL